MTSLILRFRVDRPRSLSVGSNAALLSLVILFLGFFLYHSLVAKGVVTPTLRGYSGAVSVMVLPIVAIAYARHIKLNSCRLQYDWLFLGFVAYYSFVIALSAGLGAEMEIVRSHAATIPQWLVLFGMARLIDVSKSSFAVVLRLVISVMLVIILIGSTAGVFVYQNEALDRAFITYQSYGFMVMVTALFCAASSRSVVLRVTLYCLSVVALFLIGARSEFVGFIFGAACLEFSLARNHTRLTILTLGVVFGALILIDRLPQLFPSNRIIELLEFSAMGSVGERETALAQALESIAANPIFGMFGSYEVGMYAHNILSAWVDLGLTGLLWIGVVIGLPLADYVRRSRRQRLEPQFALAFSICASCALLLAVSKPFFYMLVPIAAGLSARYYAHRESVRRLVPIE